MTAKFGTFPDCGPSSPAWRNLNLGLVREFDFLAACALSTKIAADSRYNTAEIAAIGSSHSDNFDGNSQAADIADVGALLMNDRTLLTAAVGSTFSVITKFFW